MNLLVLLLFVFCIINVRGEVDNCNFGTCGACISHPHHNCVWCAEDDIKERRCQSITYAQKEKTWCKKKFIFNPQPIMNVTQDYDFTEKIDDNNVQFKPQYIKMKARPGFPMHFNMSYKPALDFPLDVYYLMDTSFTMKEKVQDLQKQATKIYKELSGYTNNIRLGVGSFIEKPGFPFFNPTIHKGHTYRHLASLTPDTAKFQSIFKSIQFGSNYDDQEAGLDALMQAMVCGEKIGWRSGARRIIVLCTDSTYHSAGDGKFVGAFKHHDMKCYLNNNTYTMDLTLDYPSVGQINKVAIDGNFRIIFAATKNADKEYKALAAQILGARYARLEGETSVITIIKQAYEESTRTVQLNYNLPPFIQLSVDQNCNSKPPRNCESNHNQALVTIPAILTVTSCPDNKKIKHLINVTTVGLGEKVTIELEIDCTCDCEKQNDVSSPRCNNAGSYKCGVCKCLPGRYGETCQCSGSSTDRNDLEKCKLNKGDSKLCSGKGTCRCGKCEGCLTGFSGDFCEFDNNSCPKPNKQLCSGKGNCTRGMCVCESGWLGKDCSCPKANDDCIAPQSKEICSGNGNCNCGKCVCNQIKDTKETYSGVFCDICEDCAEKRCKELEDYAYCNYEHMNKDSFCDQKNNGSLSDVDVYFINKTEINGPTWYMAKWCKKQFDNGTYIVFKYQYNDHDLILLIQKEPELPPKANIWVAAGSAIGIVLLIGILTVIVWKVLADLHDKREYEKFKAAAAADGYNVSPNILYEPPTTNFNNPTFDPRNN